MPHGCGVDFRNIDIDANGADLRNDEKLLVRTAVAGIDQRTDVCIALDDDAGKRRIDMLERFKLFQATNVGSSGSERGLPLGVAAGFLIGFLLGYGIHFAE